MLCLRRKIGRSIIMEVLDVRIMLTLLSRDRLEAVMSLVATDSSSPVTSDVGAIIRRHSGESIVVTVDDIEVTITVSEFTSDDLKLAIEAPRCVNIARHEITMQSSRKEDRHVAAT